MTTAASPGLPRSPMGILGDREQRNEISEPDAVNLEGGAFSKVNGEGLGFDRAERKTEVENVESSMVNDRSAVVENDKMIEKRFQQIGVRSENHSRG